MTLSLLLCTLLLGIGSSSGFQGPFASPKLLSRFGGELRVNSGRNRLFSAVTKQQDKQQCPPGYYLDSVNQCCNELGPLGRASQVVEGVGPLQRVSRSISNLFGVDTQQISRLGVAFALSYSIISNINGSVSLSIAWYMSCQRTGLSPLAPGQWKSLLRAYGTLYAGLQLLRPFRVATAVAMSKLSNEFLVTTQDKLDCSKGVAIAVQYALGWLAWAMVASTGIALASLASGVPIFVH